MKTACELLDEACELLQRAIRANVASGLSLEVAKVRASESREHLADTLGLKQELDAQFYIRQREE